MHGSVFQTQPFTGWTSRDQASFLRRLPSLRSNLLPRYKKSLEKVFLGLGSNLGDRIKNLNKALNFISKKASILKISPVYETTPLGYEAQPDFLNIVCLIDTNLSPQEFL